MIYVGASLASRLVARVLLGMGADSLSLTPSMLPEIKYLVRNMDMDAARKLVDEVLALNDSGAVVGRLEEFRDQVIAKQ